MRSAVFAVAASGFLAASACAQPVIDWYTIDGGGGTSSAVLPGGDTIAISGTIGQPDAGPAMSGGAFTITGGFWAGFASPPPTACDPDYNQDGNADQDDVAYLVNVIAGAPNPSGRDPDFNQDGNVDQDDYITLVNVIAGAPCP
jgi:hypothetical protein